MLKSEVDIAPVYHRLPQRIRAHATLCYMALILQRVMRHRLKLAKSELSPNLSANAKASRVIVVNATCVSNCGTAGNTLYGISHLSNGNMSNRQLLQPPAIRPAKNAWKEVRR